MPPAKLCSFVVEFEQCAREMLEMKPWICKQLMQATYIRSHPASTLKSDDSHTPPHKSPVSTDKIIQNQR